MGESRAAAEAPTRRIEGFAVAGGVWATAVPFPSPLAYSYSYAVRAAEGIVVVDLGWDSDEAWSAFRSGLARAGHSLDEVIGAVVTHAHPDHYGLARRIREHTTAWIAAHPAERAQIRVGAAERRARVVEIADWLGASGVPATRLAGLESELAELEAALPGIEADVELLDGAAVPGTGGALVAIHTPGHTTGHLCFHDRERGLVFTGDHVLPKVTPNVALRPGSAADPLLAFLDSLRYLRDLPDNLLALPGHEWSFDRLYDRLGVLEVHHQSRLREIEQAVREGRETVWDVSRAVRWARPFDSFTPRSLRSALAETYAHLARLSEDGRLVRRAGRPERWTVARGRCD
ncbi:beta-lactamase domain protein [Parafrankia sp. EAN1pec]|uniref:MBL fold metallo-hydrolase n=1 Tax=Parafrankia sp. (strain EAN1pec) TaxID=298653 RepID=UPI0000542109|nr:beta-lactamase domain protein [Frankia sp. EAN1pec]